MDLRNKQAMSNCDGVCGNESVQPAEPRGLSRRALLASFGAGLAAMGFSTLGETAAYAAKTYTVCKTTDVKVGSGKVFRPKGSSGFVLVTQPRKGVWRAFDARCTHERVPVAGASNNVVVCNQHGAKFNADTGAATGGPARRSLAKYKVAISGTSVKVTF
jgi:nitrite reductase/ring-hydroxylating ferredoxin subunit